MTTKLINANRLVQKLMIDPNLVLEELNDRLLNMRPELIKKSLHCAKCCIVFQIHI